MYEIRSTFKTSNSKPILSIDADIHGKYLVVGQFGVKGKPNISLINLNNPKEIATILNEPGEIVDVVRFSPDGSEVAYAHTGQQVMVYDLNSHKHTQLSQNNSTITKIHFANNSTLVASGTKTEVWNYSKKQLIFDIQQTTSDSGVHPISVLNKKGDTLFLGGSDSTIQVFDVATKKVISILEDAPQEIIWMSISADEKYLCAIENNYKGTFLWDIKSKKRYLPNDFGENMDKISCAVFHPSSKYLALGMLSGYVTLVNLETMEYIVDEKAHKNKVTEICFSKNGSTMFTASEDGTILEWKN